MSEREEIHTPATKEAGLYVMRTTLSPAGTRTARKQTFARRTGRETPSTCAFHPASHASLTTSHPFFGAPRTAMVKSPSLARSSVTTADGPAANRASPDGSASVPSSSSASPDSSTARCGSIRAEARSSSAAVSSGARRPSGTQSSRGSARRLTKTLPSGPS